MSHMPREPEAFCEQVAHLFRRMCPDRDIDMDGVLGLIVDGRHLGLENLYRMVLGNPDRGVEIVEEYLDHLVEGEEASGAALPFELAKARIMPRIQPLSIFEYLEEQQVAYSPFVNDTVILYVLDLPHVTVSISVEQMMGWKLEVEDLDQLARKNLVEYQPELKLRLIEPESGGRAIILAEQDGYDASRLLLKNLYARLAPQLGNQFYVATPARDSFLALSLEPGTFVDRIHDRIAKDFHRMPYPITDKYYIVTLDGIAGTEEMPGEGEQEEEGEEAA
ncbi:MAG: DUF1444 family protein [Planctomycetes bacterium]|nr:DUF1444 family protein [Planctomycetota bacterium]